MKRRSALAPRFLSRLSYRDRILVVLLLATVVLFLVTGPYRAQLRRETARIEQETEQRTVASRAQDALQAEEVQAHGRVAKEPQNAEARLALASVLARQQKRPEAIQELRAAIALAPQSAEPHVALGEILDANGLSDLAVEEYRKALALEPDNARALPLLAYKYVAFGWNSEAESLVTRALKASPNEVRLHVALGLVHFQRSNFAAAERELLTARRLAPDDPTILAPLIQVYQRSSRYDDALKTIDEAMKDAPDKMPLYLEQAQVYLDRRDPASAEVAADTALRRVPENLKARYLRGIAHKSQGKTNEAIADLEYVYARDPNVGKTVLHLGQLYAQNGRKSEGDRLIADYNRRLAASENRSRLILRVASKPDDVEARLELTRAYLAESNFPQAIVESKRILELRPTHAEARTLLIRALQGAGRDAEAQAVAQNTPQQQAPSGPGKENE